MDVASTDAPPRFAANRPGDRPSAVPTAARSIADLLRDTLPAPVARLGKRIATHPRSWTQRWRCRDGFVAHGAAYPHPRLFVAGLPKSGTTWLERMLTSYPGLSAMMVPAATRYEMATGRSHDWELPRDFFARFDRMLVVAKLHVHASPHNVGLLRAAGVPYVVLHRDLRDVAVSFCAYVQRTPWHPEHAVYRGRSTREALALFAVRTLPAYAAWIRDWRARRDPALSIEVRYEDLLHDTAHELTRVAAHFGLDASPETIGRIVAAHAFARASGGRRPGEERRGSFLRSGTAGDWLRHFTPELTRLYDDVLGTERPATHAAPGVQVSAVRIGARVRDRDGRVLSATPAS